MRKRKSSPSRKANHSSIAALLRDAKVIAEVLDGEGAADSHKVKAALKRWDAAMRGLKR